MEERSGKKAGSGIAIGKLRFHAKPDKEPIRRTIDDVQAEYSRYEEARNKAIEELQLLYNEALLKAGETEAEIFNVHRMMLEDGDYNDSVKQIIFRKKVNAEYAVAQTGKAIAERFAHMEDAYFQARSADIHDITQQVLAALSGRKIRSFETKEPVIVMAEDLSPSETVQMDKNKILAFVTRAGSTNSHTAILARTMGIPALVGVAIDPSFDGKTAVVDAETGKLIVEPDLTILEEYFQKKSAQDEKKRLLMTLKGQENVTRSGRKIELLANIGSPEDLPAVLENDAGGIGLFRSEFLYLGAGDYPTEEEQFQAYKKALETMEGRKVVIRTLDIGADKQADYFGLEPEENPAMGYRAIRICLTRPEIFNTQLRALFRASAYGNLAIMYPMITSLQEVRQIKAMSAKVREALMQEGIPVGKVEEGIMIETPAAALISDMLAAEVDFFSIGTNDLTQYTLAIDRQNERLAPFYDSHHPAILRLLQMVADNAHRAGIWVGICGELGADVTLTETFLKMGMDELSVSPCSILPIRKIIRDAE